MRGKYETLIFNSDGSGSGKTTLAKSLEIFFPSKFHRVLELTTREPRTDEIEGIDYGFITKEQFQNLEKSNKLSQKIKYQFGDCFYGSTWDQYNLEKWNIVVVAIEGLMNAIKNLKETDLAVVLNIIVDDQLDIEREGRNPNFENQINQGILHSFLVNENNQSILRINGKKLHYHTINLSYLKTIRNNRLELEKYLDKICVD